MYVLVICKVIFKSSIRVSLVTQVCCLTIWSPQRELKQAGPSEWIQTFKRHGTFAIPAFLTEQYGRVPVQAESSPSKARSTSSQGAWQMGKQNRVYSVCCWCHHWTWECVEISIHVLQEWRRYVTFFFFFLIFGSVQYSFLFLLLGNEYSVAKVFFFFFSRLFLNGIKS